MNGMTVLTALATGAVSLALVASPAAADVRHERGDLVSITPIERLTRAELATYLDNSGMDVPRTRFGTDAYRVVYRTITPQGKPTTASGLVAFPRNDDRRLRLVTFLHGTNATKNTTASRLHEAPDRARSLLFAGAGFAVAAPDYLGLGVGPGRHPYADTDSETSASIDLLQATKKIARMRDVSLHRGVDLTGFSQGGRGALSVGRALQRGEAPGFDVHAMAPVAGPYDTLGVELPALVDGRVTKKIATLYTAYLLTSWSYLMDLYDDPAEAFQPRYAGTVDGLMDGTHPFPEIAAGLPGSPRELLTDEYWELMKHPTGEFRARLAYADQICTDWRPRAPIRMYVGSADADVPAANAESCKAKLRQNGVHSKIVDVGPVDHNTTGVLAYPQILRWFERL